MDNLDYATVLWSLFCGLVFLYSLFNFSGFGILAWGGAFIISLFAVKLVVERESRITHAKRTEEET